eukprot:scaffold34082_cov62-Phaeocystis_antarctica.AAC.2
MRAFDCMRRVRAREVVARAYGDVGIRCTDRTARRLWCAGESWPSCTEEGRRSAATRFKLGAAASKSTLRFVEDASRPGGSATASRSPAAGGSAASAQGLLGGSGGCDAAGAAAAELAARHSRRRWREFPVAPGSGEMPTERRLGSGSLALRSAVLVRGLRRRSSNARSAPATLVRKWVGLEHLGHLELQAPNLKLETPVRAHEREHLLDQGVSSMLKIGNRRERRWRGHPDVQEDTPPGGSGGSDATGAAAAWLAARFAVRRWRAFSVVSAALGWCCSLNWWSKE